ncbi:glycosyltransferase family 4 protein [Luteithermobacter gelatinilyticus]|uniref:glycosyltransferase family 4 protein n=1 Tax=Luteithermobacter gelatinilyticus TaxID=2582913 RepID=UPI0011057B7A|nr:glycosyltransferase family 4 protein [Luteithermobacter gelatinilyticus]
MHQTRSKHILHIIPSFAHGGVPIRICYLINHFGNRARHSLIAMDGRYDCRTRLRQDVEFNVPSLPHRAKGSLPLKILAYRDMLKRLQPDLLLTYNWGAMDWALANSCFNLCPQYHLESGFGPEEARQTLFKRDLYRRLALRRIKGIVVPSFTLVEICRTRWHIPDAKIHHIPNGVDCDKYGAAPADNIIPGLNREKQDIVIGTMTPLRPEKNLPRLIRCFHTLRQKHPRLPLRLVILGEGGERARLEQLIAQLGLETAVLLPGHIDTPAQALGWFDIYAISSDTEQMPNAVNQAMAAGLPVAGLAVGDVLPMVSDANKPFIAPRDDEDSFTHALEALALNQKIRHKVGAANQIHVRQTYDQSVMYKAYAEIWGLDLE